MPSRERALSLPIPWLIRHFVQKTAFPSPTEHFSQCFIWTCRKTLEASRKDLHKMFHESFQNGGCQHVHTTPWHSTHDPQQLQEWMTHRIGGSYLDGWCNFCRQSATPIPWFFLLEKPWWFHNNHREKSLLPRKTRSQNARRQTP